MTYFLTLDCGNTMCKAVIFSIEGKEAGIGSSKPATLCPRPGMTERNLDDLWNHASRAIRTALKDSGIRPEEIACVTVTGYGNGLYCLDENLQPSRNGILSIDTRASETVEKLLKEGTLDKVHHLTCNQVWVASPPVLLRWIKENEPDVYRRTRHIAMVKDLIKLRLTGELNTDHTDFTGGALANPSSIAYEKSIFDAYGIPEVWDMLPPMLDSWAIGGAITSESSCETGLRRGTPVAVGGMDMHMTALGCGCLEPGQLSIIVGTWSINSLLLARPTAVREIVLCSTYCSPGRWLLVDGSPSSAANLDWFVEQFCHWEQVEAKKRGISPFDIVNEEIEAMDPADCTILFHPFIYGNNVPAQPNARAGFYGLGGWHTRADLLRAVYEGVCFSHLTHVEKLRAVERDREAFIAGGGKRSGAWTQMFADVLNVPIKVPKSDELGALGCAVTGAVATGFYPDHQTAVKHMCSIVRSQEPNPEYSRIYMKKYELYRMLLDSMGPAWNRMHREFQNLRS